MILQVTCVSADGDYNRRVPPKVDSQVLASELRVVLGQLVRRLRVEHNFPVAQATVLGRLDREGERSVSDLAVAERVRQQSMAQTVAELEADGLVARRPDPADGRRALVALTEHGHSTLAADRRQREGWLAQAIAELSAEEQAVLRQAAVLLGRVAES